jgi:transcriptional regulator with XRE-family HTH domain
VDPIRFGLKVRALRRRRSGTQRDLARAARLSQSAISRIERGDAGGVLLARLEAVVRALGGRLELDVRWRGEELDRLLDARHSELCGQVVTFLRGIGWRCEAEVTFSVWGERGSTDVLAFHPATGSLVVVEAKTALASAEELLRRLNVKVRLAGEVAVGRFGWTVRTVSAVVVFEDSMTSRRRLSGARVVTASLPLQGVPVRRWLRAPSGTIRGVWFLSNSRVRGDRRNPRGSHRVRGAKTPDSSIDSGPVPLR